MSDSVEQQEKLAAEIVRLAYRRHEERLAAANKRISKLEAMYEASQKDVRDMQVLVRRLCERIDNEPTSGVMWHRESRTFIPWNRPPVSPSEH